MAKRIVTKIGDVFCIVVDNGCKRYFQYIANDMSCMNSSTIRVFQKTYSSESNPVLEEIVSDEVEFYAHTVLKFGIQDGLWSKVGNNKDIGCVDSVMFRITSGRSPLCLKSYDWYVWHISKEAISIGELTEDYASCTDYGGVFPPEWIVDRIKFGKWQCVLPY